MANKRKANCNDDANDDEDDEDDNNNNNISEMQHGNASCSPSVNVVIVEHKLNNKMWNIY